MCRAEAIEVALPARSGFDRILYTEGGRGAFARESNSAEKAIIDDVFPIDLVGLTRSTARSFQPPARKARSRPQFSASTGAERTGLREHRCAAKHRPLPGSAGVLTGEFAMAALGVWMWVAPRCASRWTRARNLANRRFVWQGSS